MSDYKDKVKRISLLLFASASSFAFAEDVGALRSKPLNSNVTKNNVIAYSQDNLPDQPQIKGAINKDYPVIVNIDLFLSRIIGQAAIAAGANVGGNSQQFYDFNNKAKFGFRIGAGIGLRNRFNISLQYTWMNSEGHETKTLAAIDPGGAGKNSLYTLNFPIGSNLAASGLQTISAVSVEAKQDLRYQTLDLLLQTASWMMASYFRFQPFGGLRYMYYKRDLSSNITIPAVQPVNQGKTRTLLKIHATGVLVGTDIKYIVNRCIYFFSNLTAGILAGQQSLNDSYDTSIALNPTTNTTKNRTELNFSPVIEARFGFAWEHMFSDDVLLSLRLAYELSSFLHNAALPFTFGAPGSETTVKTQAGVFGITAAF